VNDGPGFAGEGDEPIEIDVRSPGERWADSGRDGIERLLLLIFGGLAAIVMAEWFDTPAARLALRLAMIGGAWAVVTSMFGIAVAFHVSKDGTTFTSSAANKYVQALSAAAIGGLGLVTAFVAWRMSARPYASDERAESELAELS
jgi:hypothetical protein